MVEFEINTEDPEVVGTMVDLTMNGSLAVGVRRLARWLLLGAGILVLEAMTLGRTHGSSLYYVLLAVLLLCLALQRHIQRAMLLRSARKVYPREIRRYQVTDQGVVSRTEREENSFTWALFRQYGTCGPYFYMMDPGTRVLLADQRSLEEEKLRELRHLAGAHIEKEINY